MAGNGKAYQGREIARQNGNGGAEWQNVGSRGIIGEHWGIPSRFFENRPTAGANDNPFISCCGISCMR